MLLLYLSLVDDSGSHQSFLKKIIKSLAISKHIRYNNFFQKYIVFYKQQQIVNKQQIYNKVKLVVDKIKNTIYNYIFTNH